MEITDRDPVGENLIAPQVNDKGQSEWSYDTVRYVRPGDVILHWRKNHGPALTGYSHCLESARESSLQWKSRGTSSRLRPPQGEEDAWEALLQGYREFERPLTLDTVRTLEGPIRDVRDELTRKYGAKKGLYFPFALSDKRPIRGAQAYLVKFPAALVHALPGLDQLNQLVVDRPEEDQTSDGTRSRQSGSGYGRQPDPARRRAVERYAVDLVMAHYERLGFIATDVGAVEPWDVTLARGGRETHVEVKASTTDRRAVDVTEGEVRHAEARDTILIVIDQISMDSSLECSGGRWRYWSTWSPDRTTLIPTAYRHLLGEDGTVGRPEVS
ncbi:protein NO VEIN domain-containing protein [Arthrobacter citreus]